MLWVFICYYLCCVWIDVVVACFGWFVDVVVCVIYLICDCLVVFGCLFVVYYCLWFILLDFDLLFVCICVWVGSLFYCVCFICVGFGVFVFCFCFVLIGFGCTRFAVCGHGVVCVCFAWCAIALVGLVLISLGVGCCYCGWYLWIVLLFSLRFCVCWFVWLLFGFCVDLVDLFWIDFELVVWSFIYLWGCGVVLVVGNLGSLRSMFCFGFYEFCLRWLVDWWFYLLIFWFASFGWILVVWLLRINFVWCLGVYFI